MKKNLNITEIEALSRVEVEKYAIEKICIKEFNIYLVDLGSYFGYSALVFKDSHHIYFANLYGANQIYDDHIQLREKYINSLNNMLFLDDELTSATSYDDHEKKANFIRNYMPQEYEYLTIFCIKNYQGEDLEKYKSGKYTYYSDIAFAYFKDTSYQDRAEPLIKKLRKSYTDIMEDLKEFKKAVKKELHNYEACITYEYDTALGALGIVFEELPKAKQNAVLEAFKEVTSERGY